MQIYLAGENGKWRIIRTLWGGIMNLYLAGEHPVKNGTIAAQRGAIPYPRIILLLQGQQLHSCLDSTFKGLSFG